MDAGPSAARIRSDVDRPLALPVDQASGFRDVKIVFPVIGLAYLGMMQTALNRLGFTPNLLYNWLKRNGGLEAMEKINRQKAEDRKKQAAIKATEAEKKKKEEEGTEAAAEKK